MSATRSAEIRSEHPLGSEGWQARGKEVDSYLDNLMLDVGCNPPPLWWINELRLPHGRGWHPIREAGRKPGYAPTPTGRFREQSSYE